MSNARVNNLARLKSALASTNIQAKNPELYHVVEQLIAEVQRLYNTVLPPSSDENATVAVPQVNQSFVTLGNEEVLNQSRRILPGMGIQFNNTGRDLIIGSSYLLAIDGEDGAAGSGSSEQIEQDLGSTPKSFGQFVVVNANISGTSKIMIQQGPGPYTGKGTLADEASMDQLWCFAVPAAGSMTVYWRVNPMTSGRDDESRGIQSTVNPYLIFSQPRILGKVKGNFKFNYTVGG